MEAELNFIFPLPNGLHARPASQLAELISRLSGDVAFMNLRNGHQANGRSPLAMVATDTRAGDPCRFRLIGTDPLEVKQRIESYLQGDFLTAEKAFESLPVHRARPLSRALLATGVKRFVRAQVACSGVGEGRMVWFKKVPPASAAVGTSGNVAQETARLDRALQAVAERYRQELAATTGTAAGILRAQLALLQDTELKTIVAGLLKTGASAADAVNRAIDGFKGKLLASKNDYLHARTLDLEDIGDQLVDEICGRGSAARQLELNEPAILLADHLTPKQFLSLDHRHLKGLALSEAGQTSHTVILARSLNVPTLIDLPLADLQGIDGCGVLDAQAGLLVYEDSPALRDYYAMEKEKLVRIRKGQDVNLDVPGRTADGFSLEVGANIMNAEEAVSSFRQGADGIGLFRTEFLFTDRDEAPGEEEQYQAYVRVVQEARGRPVIIRAFDIGGDKPAPYLPLPHENNPFLGYRGVRLYREHAGLITTQFRALWRAAFHGPIKVMVPMISCVEEARETKAMLDRVGAELRCEKSKVGASLSFGLMLEIPSVAFMLPELCEVVDFFSVGTNDLTQYFLAADRENKAVTALFSPLHPSFLRLLEKLVGGAHAHGRWIGLCGGMAENIPTLPLLVGLGFDEISLPAANIPAIKSALTQLRRKDCELLLQRALASSTRAEVELLVAGEGASTGPLLEPALVALDIDARTKHEAIRGLVNTLEVAGRTLNADELEEAIWRREEAYSTGFGSGFALPHCKSNHVSDNSIVVLRLKEPVKWGSLDGLPVDVIICLAIRESDHGRAHMRNIARLSRLMMDETFRNQVREATTASATVELITAYLEPSASSSRTSS